MSLRNCDIVFNNQDKTYYPGQTVKGIVNFSFNFPKEIRGISIKFEGEATTKWTKRNGGNRRRRPRYFTATEEFFKFQYYLLGSQTGDRIEIPAGTHSYSFSCVLPSTLPASFEGKFGHIRYTVKITLDIPWESNQENETAFIIISTIDLNLNPQVKTPIDVSFRKNFGSTCLGCCEAGSITMIGSLPYTGYVSGQEIPLSLEIDNNSDVEFESIHVELKKKILFHSQRPSRRTKKLVETVWELIIQLNDGFMNSNTICTPIAIPALPPSLEHCSIIDLDYEIKVYVNFKGIRGGAYIKIPIIIGTIPLTSSQLGATTIGFMVNSTESSAPPETLNSDITLDPDAPPPPYCSLYPNMRT